MLAEVDGIIRLVAALIVGLLIGISRRGKPAGIRTFALICLGSTVFTLISVADIYGGAVDPTRVIAQIVAGIGFLGLGVIWKQNTNKPGGLTTAASIWVTASVGVLVGLGMWAYAIVTTLFTFIVLISKRPLVKARMDE